MRILILGGTVFLGRHLAELARTRGHELTLFHRGQHGAELFPGTEHLLGDRDGDLEVLGPPGIGAPRGSVGEESIRADMGL